MAETVTIPRLIDDHEKTPGKPGWYAVREYQSEKSVKPLIRCNCGEVSGIGLHHVHADGKVTASFWHATAAELAAMPDGKRFAPGCGWHVFLILADYDQGDFPPEPRAPLAKAEPPKPPTPARSQTVTPPQPKGYAVEPIKRPRQTLLTRDPRLTPK